MNKEIHKTVITLPVSIGDTIYEKKSRIINCRYWGDEYSDEDGYPNCSQHEYDCSSDSWTCQTYKDIKPCDAETEYFVKPVIVDESVILRYVQDFLCNRNYTSKYLLTKEEADSWIDSMSTVHK
jgi:hypothetical protein